MYLKASENYINSMSISQIRQNEFSGWNPVSQNPRSTSKQPPTDTHDFCNMMTIRNVLASAGLFASMAFTARGTQIEFCTGSVYAPGEPCPEAQPVSGSGTCYNLTVKADTCCEAFT